MGGEAALEPENDEYLPKTGEGNGEMRARAPGDLSLIPRVRKPFVIDVDG